MAIAERAKLLRPGARVVTFTTALKTPWLGVLMKRRYQMSWGPATVFIHQKLRWDPFRVCFSYLNTVPTCLMPVPNLCVFKNCCFLVCFSWFSG